MKIVSLEEMREFILKQEDARRVAPMNGRTDMGHCGCVLVHYCREKQIPFTQCGFITADNYGVVTLRVENSILRLFKEEMSRQIIGMEYEDTISYGELKRNLK